MNKILIAIMMLMTTFTMSLIETTAQTTQFNGSLQSVDLIYNGTSTNTQYWNITRSNQGYFDGWVVLGWPDNQSLINDVNYMPEGDYVFHSYTKDYRYLYFGNVLMDIYSYTYSFELAKSTNYWLLYMDTSQTTDPNFQSDLDIPINFLDAPLKILDSRDNSQAIFTQGYESGKQDYGYLYNGVYQNANTWGQQQYQNGLSQGSEDTLALQNMIPGVLGVMIAFFFQLASISVLGVTILDVIALIFGIGVLLFVFKVLVK